MDPLDLDVEHRLGVQRHVHPFGKVGGQIDLVGPLGRRVIGAKARILGHRVDLLELLQIVDPVQPDPVLDQLRHGRVRRQHPAARRHAVGLVHDPVGILRVQILENSGFHQISVQRRNTIHLMRHQERQLAHLDLAALANTHLACLRSPRLRRVNPFDQRDMTRQQTRHQTLGPPLQCLGQQCVIGVRQCRACGLDRLVKSHAALVMQKPHQFWSRNRGVRVVQLDRDALG